MALLTQNDGIAAPLLEAVGVDPATIRAEAQRLDRPAAQRERCQLDSRSCRRESLAAITAAQHLATEMDDEYVSTEHLLVGLATGDSRRRQAAHRPRRVARRRCARRSPRSAAARASPAPTPRAPTRRWRSTPPT